MCGVLVRYLETRQPFGMRYKVKISNRKNQTPIMGKIANKEKISKAPLGDGGIRAGIIGGAGYTGGELIRLLIRHPYTLSLLYTSDAADERSSVDLGGRRIIKKK